MMTLEERIELSGPIPTDQEALREEFQKLAVLSAKLKLILSDPLPVQRYRQMSKLKCQVALRITEVQQAIHRQNRDIKKTKAEAFMTTVMEMFDAESVADVWDRVYVNYPHLKG